MAALENVKDFQCSAMQHIQEAAHCSAVVGFDQVNSDKGIAAIRFAKGVQARFQSAFQSGHVNNACDKGGLRLGRGSGKGLIRSK